MFVAGALIHRNIQDFPELDRLDKIATEHDNINENYNANSVV